MTDGPDFTDDDAAVDHPERRRRSDAILDAILSLAVENRASVREMRVVVHNLERRVGTNERAYADLRRYAEMLRVDELSPREAAQMPDVLRASVTTLAKADSLAKQLRFYVALFSILQGVTALGLLALSLIVYLHGGR